MPVTVVPRYECRGLGCTIDRYTVLIVSDQIVVAASHAVVVDRRVPHLGQLLVNARELRLGFGVEPNGEEVLYIYDRAARNFGYALSLSDNRRSTWGYLPIPGVAREVRNARGGDA